MENGGTPAVQMYLYLISIGPPSFAPLFVVLGLSEVWQMKREDALRTVLCTVTESA